MRAGLRVCAHAIATPRYLSLRKRRSTRACGARAPRRAGCSRPMSLGRTLNQREASLLRCNAMLRRVRRSLQREAGFRVSAHAIAPLSSSSVGMRRGTRACGARAPRRAGCSRPVPYERTPHQRGASLLGRKTVLRHDSCGLQRKAGLRVCAYAIAPPRYLSLRKRRSTHACGARAPRRAGCSRSVSLGRALNQREASLLRCKAVLRCASRWLQQTVGLRVSVHAMVPLRSLSRDEAQHARLRRARAAPRWL